MYNATHVAVQPDGKHLTTVSDTGEVAIHSFGEPERIIVMPSADEAEYGKVEDLSLDGLRYAVEGDPAHQIRLEDISSSPAPEVTLDGHRDNVRILSFDPSGDFLASTDGSEVIIWSAKDRAELRRIPLPEGYVATSLAVSPEGRYIATSSPDGKILLWDTTSNDRAKPLLVEGTASLTFSPDDRWLSIGSQNEIRLWNLDMGKFGPQRIPIPTSGTIKFSPNSTLLATSRLDSRASEVTVWNVRDAQIAGTVIADRFGYDGDSFAFTPDRAWLAVARQGVVLGPLAFDAPSALRHICRITRGYLTEKEWNQHAPRYDYIAACP